MATVQDVRDFTAWHDGTLFHLRNIAIPAIRRGAIDDAQVCLARRMVARRPNVSLGAMAEANSNELLGTHPLDIDGMTAHAVVGQLAERLMIELREAEHARELKGDLQTQRDELQELCRQLDEFDWDDLDRRLPRESTRMIGRMESANDVQKSELSSTGTATTPEASKSSTDGKPKKATVNARMIDTLGKRPEAKDWSITQWQNHLGGPARSTIHGTKTWQELEKMRTATKVTRLNRDSFRDDHGRRKANLR